MSSRASCFWKAARFSHALLVAALRPEPRLPLPGEAGEGHVHVVGRAAHQPDGHLGDPHQAAVAPLQILLRAGDQVADVDRLARLGVGHQAVVGVLELAVEHGGQRGGRPGQRRVLGHVVDALVAEPHLALAGPQTLQERLTAAPSPHDAVLLSSAVDSGASKRR